MISNNKLIRNDLIRADIDYQTHIVPLDSLEGDRGSGVEALSQHGTKQLHENSANLIIRVVTSDIYNLPWVSPCITVIRIATWKMDFVESSFYLLCT